MVLARVMKIKVRVVSWLVSEVEAHSIRYFGQNKLPLNTGEKNVLTNLFICDPLFSKVSQLHLFMPFKINTLTV